MADPTLPGWPSDGPDEFAPYLAEQLQDSEVRAAYEAERADPYTDPADATLDPR